MNKDYSSELKTFLEEHSRKKNLNINFQCNKELNVYRVIITDSHGNEQEKIIEQEMVTDFIKNHKIASEREILEIIFNPGPKITKSP